jgi:hypothetical protein
VKMEEGERMKLSIDIDAARAAFVRAYQLRHGLKSRSAVVVGIACAG